MCGLVGLASPVGTRVCVEPRTLEAMRDRLAHRGPDGAGLWQAEHVVLGHRRLAVVAPGPGGHQPMESADGRHILVYNGELYNDPDLRTELGATQAWEPGHEHPADSDARTVLRVLAASADLAEPSAALTKLRGMYALAWYDRQRQQLTLARDPLGIKPLYLWRGLSPDGTAHVAFASELPALLALPMVPARPDWATISAYLTTIRTTLGSRTLLDGITTLLPGEWVTLDLGRRPAPGGLIRERRGTTPLPRIELTTRDQSAFIARVREEVADSINRHLRSDVPLCALLSGGLDSTIVCAEARRHVATLETYCAGARGSGEKQLEDAGGAIVLRPAAARERSPDFEMARLASGALGTRHTEVDISRETFLDRWEWMVGRLGAPLSTPNEVAIHEVSLALRGRGHVVALSGEGADELFGGYDRLLGDAAGWAQRGDHDGQAGVRLLDAAAWVPRASKPGLLRPALWELVEHDAPLVETYRDDAAACLNDAHEAGWGGAEATMQGVLRHQRRVNLAGLLARLDTATMLAGVEGRTPLADARVAALGEMLPMGLKFIPGGGTKIALRRAFAGVVPEQVLARPKASFPLPFQAWMAEATNVLESSDLVESVFEAGAIDLVRADPGRSWNLAWPMLNLALWGRAMRW